jgi:4-hydroxybenzoate polyprenyltransferase
MIAEAKNAAVLPPVCVDLDHTLLKTDLLYETLILLLKRHPGFLIALPFWLLKGKAHLKRQLALRVQPEVAELPFRDELVTFLRSEKESGRRLVLVTAADRALAESVGKHLDIFDEVIASGENENLKGPNKARRLEERFGAKGFDYVGDSRSDLAVWRSARKALIVTNSGRFTKWVGKVIPVEKVFSRSDGSIISLVKACRLHHWSKNLLVFVPIVTSHKIFDPAILAKGWLAFFSFSFIASGVYLINDLLDLEADRRHAAKRFRALAFGEISILSAICLAAGMLIPGLVLGFFCGSLFLAFLAIYGFGNLVYSLWIKRVVMLDVVVLACFYSLRLLAGGAATEIGCSEWLLAFSVFFFFCLAMIKRYSELRQSQNAQGEIQKGRGYLRSDLDAVGSFGVSSGLISVLVLVLYSMSPEVRVLYNRPTLLLLLCPLFLYWITRLWFKAQRGEVPEDPVIFALKDRTSYLAGVLAVTVLYAATI